MTSAPGANAGKSIAPAGAVGVKKEETAVNKEDSGDWLADIFDAVDEDAITSLEMGDVALPQDILAKVDEGSASAVAAGKKEEGVGKRGRGEGGEELSKVKKSRREKLRREALNDRCVRAPRKIARPSCLLSRARRVFP
jgi:hypothetical protein